MHGGWFICILRSISSREPRGTREAAQKAAKISFFFHTIMQVSGFAREAISNPGGIGSHRVGTISGLFSTCFYIFAFLYSVF